MRCADIICMPAENWEVDMEAALADLPDSMFVPQENAPPQPRETFKAADPAMDDGICVASTSSPAEVTG